MVDGNDIWKILPRWPEGDPRGGQWMKLGEAANAGAISEESFNPPVSHPDMFMIEPPGDNPPIATGHDWTGNDVPVYGKPPQGDHNFAVDMSTGKAAFAGNVPHAELTRIAGGPNVFRDNRDKDIFSGIYEEDLRDPRGETYVYVGGGGLEDMPDIPVSIWDNVIDKHYPDVGFVEWQGKSFFNTQTREKIHNREGIQPHTRIPLASEIEESNEYQEAEDRIFSYPRREDIPDYRVEMAYPGHPEQAGVEVKEYVEGADHDGFWYPVYDKPLPLEWNQKSIMVKGNPELDRYWGTPPEMGFEDSYTSGLHHSDVQVSMGLADREGIEDKDVLASWMNVRIPANLDEEDEMWEEPNVPYVQTYEYQDGVSNQIPDPEAIRMVGERWPESKEMRWVYGMGGEKYTRVNLETGEIIPDETQETLNNIADALEQNLRNVDLDRHDRFMVEPPADDPAREVERWQEFRESEPQKIGEATTQEYSDLLYDRAIRPQDFYEDEEEEDPEEDYDQRYMLMPERPEEEQGIFWAGGDRGTYSEGIREHLKKQGTHNFDEERWFHGHYNHATGYLTMVGEEDVPPKDALKASRKYFGDTPIIWNYDNDKIYDPVTGTKIDSSNPEPAGYTAHNGDPFWREPIPGGEQQKFAFHGDERAYASVNAEHIDMVPNIGVDPMSDVMDYQNQIESGEIVLGEWMPNRNTVGLWNSMDTIAPEIADRLKQDFPDAEYVEDVDLVRRPIDELTTSQESGSSPIRLPIPRGADLFENMDDEDDLFPARVEPRGTSEGRVIAHVEADVPDGAGGEDTIQVPIYDNPVEGVNNQFIMTGEHGHMFWEALQDEGGLYTFHDMAATGLREEADIVFEETDLLFGRGHYDRERKTASIQLENDDDEIPGMRHAFRARLRNAFPDILYVRWNYGFTLEPMQRYDDSPGEGVIT